MKDKLWDEFCKSGKISDYLIYRKSKEVDSNADGTWRNNP